MKDKEAWSAAVHKAANSHHSLVTEQQQQKNHRKLTYDTVLLTKVQILFKFHKILY